MSWTAEPEWLPRANANDSLLTALDLEGRTIGADGARALAAALERNTTLTHINLGSNNIKDDGARALAAAQQAHVAVAISGTGRVVEQRPAPGSRAAARVWLRLSDGRTELEATAARPR